MARSAIEQTAQGTFGAFAGSMSVGADVDDDEVGRSADSYRSGAGHG